MGILKQIRMVAVAIWQEKAVRQEEKVKKEIFLLVKDLTTFMKERKHMLDEVGVLNVHDFLERDVHTYQNVRNSIFWKSKNYVHHKNGIKVFALDDYPLSSLCQLEIMLSNILEDMDKS